MVSQQQVTWEGATVDGFTVEGQLGQGLYSWVYSCTNADHERRALKAAKPEADVSTGICATFAFPTQAWAEHTGSMGEVQPDANELLALQLRRMRDVKTRGLPRILNSLAVPGITYYMMEFVPGINLRRLMEKGKVKTSTMIAIGETLEALLDDPLFQYHGDIKPENIMVDGDKVTILDPGFFGAVRTTQGNSYNVAVTTPSYYPEFRPNDQLAFGLMLWEVATRRHPLSAHGYAIHDPAIGFDEKRHGAGLKQYIEGFRFNGKDRFLLAFYNTVRPSETRPDIPPAQEEFLLRAVGLSGDDKKRIDAGKPFVSIAELNEKLRALLKSGVEYFG